LPADPSDQKSVDSNRVAALSRNQNVPRRHAARAHGGGALARLQDASRRVALLRPASRLAEHLLDKYSDYRARAFDRRYGIDTFERVELQHLDIPELDPRFGRWLYGPINPDFFEEMMSAIRVPFAETTFCDVGSGKGLAVLLAGSWGFKRLWGVEFSAALIERAKINASLYESKSGRRLDAEWTCGDFMELELPPEPTLFFLNNPFPAEIAERAIGHLEASIKRHPRRSWILWRKPGRDIAARLDASPMWHAEQTTPFWRFYAT
jgi:Histone methylation protein DOT1